MKGVLRIFFISLLLVLLSSCSIFEQKEDSPDFVELRAQYDTYMTNDILQEKSFHDFINDVSLSTSKSSVKIQVDFYHVLGYKTKTVFASGFVYGETDQSYVIMTVQNIFTKSNFETLRVRVIDFNGNTYLASISNESTIFNLASLMISKNDNTIIPSVELSPTQSLPNEPIMLISYQHRVINSMVMGFSIIHTTDEPYILVDTTIPSDEFGNGGMLINTSLQLIGLQLSVENGFSRALGIDTIRQYIKLIGDL